MPKCTVNLVASGVVRDVTTNNMTVYNIIEQISPEAFPVFWNELFALSMWVREPGDEDTVEVDFTIGSYDTDNKLTILGTSQKLLLNFSESQFYRAIITLTQTVLTTAGQLRFSFKRDNRILSEYNVLIREPAAKIGTSTTTTPQKTPDIKKKPQPRRRPK